MDHIGRYQVIDQLGQGGMATVYRALDPRFDREVAIKVLPRSLLHDPRLKKRFLREARIVASLEHRSIVQVYDYGEEEGQPFLVMRLLSGGTLAGRMEAGPLPLDEVTRILQRLAPALDMAHRRGLVHRDLKPANIMFDEWNEPVLTDFGIVKLVEGDTTALTASGALVGTPAYMSPEQIRGKSDLDGRSDVYSLGVILYEMLAGVQPFQATTPIGMAMQHMSEPVPVIFEAEPSLPPATQAVIERAMAKEPEGRYATATELVEAVQTLLPLAGLGAAPPPAKAPPDQRPPTGPADERPAQRQPTPAPTPPPRPARQERLTADTMTDATPVPVPTPQPKPRREVPPAARGETATPQPAPARPQQAQRAPGGFSLPGWAWWAGALAIIALIAFGAYSIFGGGDGDTGEPQTAGEQDSAVLVLPEETATATPDVEAAVVPAEDEAAPPTATLTPSPTAAVDPYALPAAPAAGDQWLRPADEMPMVWAPAGSFPMGSSEEEVAAALARCEAARSDGTCAATLYANEMPRHEVTLDGFWLDQTEVTFAQYARCVDAGACDPATTVDPAYSGDDQPVSGVTWANAEAYCTWAEARLPTEAEWEYAARGPGAPVYPWGDQLGGNVANFCDASCEQEWRYAAYDDGYALPAPTGSFPAGASWIGVLDLGGNVWEWVNDYYAADTYSTAPTANPQGPATGTTRVIRGGSFLDDPVHFVRAAGRFEIDPAATSVNIGFRCAR